MRTPFFFSVLAPRNSKAEENLSQN